MEEAEIKQKNVGEGFQPSLNFTNEKVVANMPYYSRKPTRIPNFDYSRNHYYFITICTHEKECLFGSPNHLNQLGQIAEKHIQNIPNFYQNIFIDKYVVMPNHIHLILVLNYGENNPAVPLIIGQFKRGVTMEIRTLHPNRIVWQRSFHDHIIRNQSGYEKIWTYIENNPLKWEEDCFFCKISGNDTREGWKPSPTK